MQRSLGGNIARPVLAACCLVKLQRVRPEHECLSGMAGGRNSRRPFFDIQMAHYKIAAANTTVDSALANWWTSFIPPRRSVTEEQPQQNDYRNGHTKQPKQKSSSHHRLLQNLMDLKRKRGCRVPP